VTTLLKDSSSKMAERAMAHHPLLTSSFPNSLGALDFPSVSRDSRPLRHERPLVTSQAVEVVYDICAVDSIFNGSDISGYLLYINALRACLKRRWGHSNKPFSVSFASNNTVATQQDCSPTVGEKWSLVS